jgi:phage shock protein E
MNMNWIGLLVFVVLIVALRLLRNGRQISSEDARKLLKEGAVVVDVRTPGEFSGAHLRKAINIPVDKIAEVLPKTFPDRNKTILLHCQSGMRSGNARRQLRALGYTNAFNLGSYARAAHIIEG